VIVDASVAIKWVVEEDDSDAAHTLAGREMHAPDLIWIECANILWKKTVAGDLTLAEAAIILKELRSAPVSLTPCSHLLDAALALSSKLRHPIYDCLYLALAVQKKMPLATADRRLARAVRRHRISHLRVTLLQELMAAS
jgi:predicted nucleic acid-binding protein